MSNHFVPQTFPYGHSAANRQVAVKPDLDVHRVHSFYTTSESMSSPPGMSKLVTTRKLTRSQRRDGVVKATKQTQVSKDKKSSTTASTELVTEQPYTEAVLLVRLGKVRPGKFGHLKRWSNTAKQTHVLRVPIGH